MHGFYTAKKSRIYLKSNVKIDSVMARSNVAGRWTALPCKDLNISTPSTRSSYTLVHSRSCSI